MKSHCKNELYVGNLLETNFALYEILWIHTHYKCMCILYIQIPNIWWEAQKKICFFKKREVECKSAKDAYFCLLLQLLGTHSHIGLHLWDTESHREKTSRCCCYSYWLVSELKKKWTWGYFFFADCSLLSSSLVKFVLSFPRVSSSFFVRF